MPGTCLLDTSALLAHYRDEAGAGQVQSIFESDHDDVLVASVSLVEFARRLRDLGVGPEEARVVLQRYLQALTAVVPIDAAVAIQAWELLEVMPSRLPLVDSLIAAAARSRQARLVHRDSHMRAIPSKWLRQVDLDSPRGPESAQGKNKKPTADNG